MRPLLDIQNLRSWYGPTQALFDVSFSIQPGEAVGLMGRNGMGKSTTVKSICGLLPRAAGTIDFAGTALIGMPSYKIARLGIGLVPEGRRVFPNLSVMENLTVAAVKGFWDLKKVYGIFPRLKERAAQSGATLSGGEQQMLAIGRALMTNPKLMILDEATEGLAPLIRTEIWQALHQLKLQGQAVLVVDGNFKDSLAFVDKCTILERGKSVWSGHTNQLSDEILDRYLGV